MIVLRDGRQDPANLDAIDADLPALWIAVLATNRPTLARARLADLLWKRREGQRAYLFAQQAIDAYVDLASQTRAGIRRLYQVQDACRAIAIARELRDTSPMETCAQTLIALAHKELNEADPAPGVVLRALEPLVPDCPTALVTERPDLLQQSIVTYEADPFNFHSANELYAATLPLDDRPAVYASVVERWNTAAGTAEGLTQLLHLEQPASR